MREAPVLYHNLRAALSGGKQRTYSPQTDYLKLVSFGETSALAERFGTARKGRLLWRLKDGIDRRFMQQFANLTKMDLPELPREVALGMSDALGDKMMCGGCGAKVGRTALAHVLGENFGDDAAIVQTGQVMSTDHLRALVDDPVTMAQIAAMPLLR